MATNNPWFKFYYKDWLTSPAVISMTKEQRDIYLTLLCYLAGEGEKGIKNDKEKLMELLKCNENDLNIVLERVYEQDGKLFNKKLLEALNGTLKKKEKKKINFFEVPQGLSPEQEIRFKKQAVIKELENFKEKYPKDLLNQFYLYWTAPTLDKKQIKIETQDTWDYEGRLRTWNQNYKPTPEGGKVQGLMNTNQDAKDILKKHEMIEPKNHTTFYHSIWDEIENKHIDNLIKISYRKYAKYEHLPEIVKSKQTEKEYNLWNKWKYKNKDKIAEKYFCDCKNPRLINGGKKNITCQNCGDEVGHLFKLKNMKKTDKYFFATKINGTDETGIVDITQNPPKLLCLCTKEDSKIILEALIEFEQMIFINENMK